MIEVKTLPKWILILSGVFALMELGVSIQLYIAPESVVDSVDSDVRYLIYMWATRQFALGVIFAFATIKRSAPMLTLAYLFFLVMFAGDLFVGILQHEMSLIMSALIMGIVAAVLLFVLNRYKQSQH